jgi:hypothetical protein
LHIFSIAHFIGNFQWQTTQFMRVNGGMQVENNKKGRGAGATGELHIMLV